jgi:hypothetical protein
MSVCASVACREAEDPKEKQTDICTDMFYMN